MVGIQPYVPTAGVQVYLVANLLDSTISGGTEFIRSLDSSKALTTHSLQVLKVLGYVTPGEQLNSIKEHTYIVKINFIISHLVLAFNINVSINLRKQ